MDPVEFAKLFNQTIPDIKVDFEYRLYYNKQTGEPIAYTMEELEGDYIEVTAEQYAQGRYDLVIRNGIIERLIDSVSWTKLVPSNAGTGCRADNVMIVEPNSNTKWGIKTYYEEDVL